MLRLLADENLDNDIIRGAQRRRPGLDILRVQSAGLSEVDDPAILSWAAEEQRIVLTHVYEFKHSAKWGEFVRYVEFGDDAFPLRQVDVFSNGYLTRYDRVHWEDQFGSLVDFKMGQAWRRNWGEPLLVMAEEFEEKWSRAAFSPPHGLSTRSPDTKFLKLRGNSNLHGVSCAQRDIPEVRPNAQFRISYLEG